MITNQRQYALAKAEVSRFEDALAKEKSKGPRQGVHARIHQAKLEGLQSQLDELSAEINEFEALSSPDTPCEFTVTSVLDLSTVLIQARIALPYPRTAQDPQLQLRPHWGLPPSGTAFRSPQLAYYSKGVSSARPSL